MLEKLPVAFLAGLVSVLTPCVLPLVPGYLSAVSAVDVTMLGERGVGKRVVAASLPFIAGFTTVFVLLGAAAAAVGSVVDQRTQFEIAGFVLVVLGLAFLGALPMPERIVAPGLLGRARGRGLERAARRRVRRVRRAVHRHRARVDPGPRLVVGNDRAGVVLLAAYSLGLGAAFVLAGIAFAHTMRAFRFVRDHYAVVRGVSGVILVTLGLLLFFNRDWWLRVALDQVFTKIGLGSL